MVVICSTCAPTGFFQIFVFEFICFYHCDRKFLGYLLFLFMFKSNERSEYSYIGLGDFFFGFFQEKALKFVHAQF